MSVSPPPSAASADTHNVPTSNAPVTATGASGQTVYYDSPIDRLFIWLFSRKMAKAVGTTSPLKGYDGLVDLSKQIMQGRNAQQQRALVRVVLGSLIPAQGLWLVRQLFSPTALVCELNAWFATKLFSWLVGPSEVREVEIVDANGRVKRQKSGVYIQKCRYLEQSRCAGMCIHMCKLPTQDFFTQEFGIPLTMTPNFEDYSCEMVFGQMPLPLEQEAVYNQPCLSAQSALAAAPCPKIRG
ncbi:MAG TPA: DUF4033 domain-containing protein [Trichocoleus sp.]